MGLVVRCESWECRARVTLEGSISDVKSDNMRSVLVVKNIINTKLSVQNTQAVNLNAI